MTRRPAQAGFTMIEVLIAILLTAIAVVGIVGLVTVETRGASTSRHTTEASMLGQDKMEWLRTQTLLTNGTGSDATPVDAQGNPGGIYTRSWSWMVGSSMVSYSVTVSWNEDGPTRQITLTSQRNP